MKFSTIISLLLIAIGIYGALFSYSFFFGFVAVGIFLIIYASTSKKEANLAPPQYLSQQNRLNPSVMSFCPKCGTPIAQGVTHCPQCGEKLREA